MKKLKFRVWTNAFMGKWEYRPVCQIRWNVNGSLTVNACDDPQWWLPVIFPNDCGHVLEQFTGVYDCEHKEVFEGDILRCVLSDGSFIDKEVAYRENHAAFCWARTSEKQYAKQWDIWQRLPNDDLKVSDRWKVVSHIHVKQKKQKKGGSR